MPCHRVRLVLALVFALYSPKVGGVEIDRIGRPAADVEIAGPRSRIKVELPDAKNYVEVVRLGDGSLGYLVRRIGSGTDRVLTPEEFTRLVYAVRAPGNWMAAVFNITSVAGIAWVGLGLVGQLLFTGRMLVQWIASERSRRSVIPISFWWMSLAGATMLLLYFIWRRDIVGVIGQATGWIIYVRNLILLRRSAGS